MISCDIIEVRLGLSWFVLVWFGVLWWFGVIFTFFGSNGCFVVWFVCDLVLNDFV